MKSSELLMERQEGKELVSLRVERGEVDVDLSASRPHGVGSSVPHPSFASPRRERACEQATKLDVRG